MNGTAISAPIRRTQAQRRAESDDRLLSAAAEIVAGEGYLALTLERVGERAGFSRGLASRKYGSKDGLIEALIRRAEAHSHDQINAALADVADPVERILVLFDRFVELVLTDASVRAYFVLYGALISNRLGASGVFEDVQQRFGARIAGLIKAGQTAGALPAELPTDHAAFMVGSLLAGISIETEMDSFDRHPRSTVPMRANLAGMLRRALGG
jgi:AcrR family transcriptional regulator